MQLTRAGEYAIRSVLYLSRQKQDSVSLLHDICGDQQIPRHLSAKVLQCLVRGNIVKSSRGSGGGYILARPPSEITLLEVIECIEGPISLNYCVKPEQKCGFEINCPFHPVWKEAQNKLRKVLASYNFFQLSEREFSPGSLL